MPVHFRRSDTNHDILSTKPSGLPTGLYDGVSSSIVSSTQNILPSPGAEGILYDPRRKSRNDYGSSLISVVYAWNQHRLVIPVSHGPVWGSPKTGVHECESQ